MINPINETINRDEAVLFLYGTLRDIAGQFAEVLMYCKKKKLHVVDIFFDTSNIKSYQKECFMQLLDYLKRNKTKTAVVFYSRNDFGKCPWTHKLEPYREKDKIELHFAKDNVII